MGADTDLVTTNLASCLDDVAALAFVEGTMTAERRSQVLDHVDTCATCQELVAGVVEMLKESDTLAQGGSAHEVPESFGSYRLGPLIAQGGMGSIYRAFDTTLKRDVALKVPQSRNDAFARRFEREAAITARLEHPGIVPIHGAGQTSDGTPFYVMRFIEGRTFDALIAEATTPAARLALVDRVVDVARTMAYVHGKRIVHRDLKPNNVLVGAFGETLIIDWGLAKQLEIGRASLPVMSLGMAAGGTRPSAAELRTHAGEVMGTPLFMPPEQAVGDPVDERADVYALGAILRNVLTGALPRNRDTAIEGPAPLVEVCRKAMAWDAADRYHDANAFADALARALEATRPAPRVPRSRVLILLAIGIALAAVAIVVSVVAIRRDALDGVKTMHVVTRLPPDTRSVTVSPSGRRVAFGTRDRFYVRDLVSGQTWTRTDWIMWPWRIEFESDDVVHYMRHQDPTDECVLVHWDMRSDVVTDAGTNGSVARDGYWLGSVREGQLFAPSDAARYFVIRSDNGVTELPSDSVQPLRIYAISPSGDRVAFVEHAQTGSAVRVVDTSGGGFVSSPIEDIAALAWSDDATLYFTIGSSNGSTLVRAPATREGLAHPTPILQTGGGGWLGTLGARGGRIVGSWLSSSYETRLYDRTARVESPLEKTSVAAALVWLDGTTYLAYTASGAVERHSIDSSVLPQVTTMRLPSEPVNATRADDVVIATLRGTSDREVIAQSVTEATPRWTAPAGTLAFVRCAGDRTAPCVAAKQGAGGLVTLVTIDPGTGMLGSEVIAEGALADAAVDPTGREVAWVVDNRMVVTRPLDRSAPAKQLWVRGGNHSIAYDPRGGLLTMLFATSGRQVVRYESTAAVEAEVVLNAGTALVSLVRSSPDGKYILYRARTLTGDLVDVR